MNCSTVFASTTLFPLPKADQIGKPCVLIVAGYGAAAPLAEMLQEKGIIPLHLKPGAHASNTAKSFRPHTFGAHFDLEPGNTLPLQFIQAIEAWKPRRIQAGQEQGVDRALQLNQYFGMAGKVNLDPRDKFETVEVSKRLNFRGIRQSLEKTPSALLAAAMAEINIAGKCVVKAPRAAGSWGVRTCFNQRDVEDHLISYFGKEDPYFQKVDSMIVQEFLQGTEYIVDIVSFMGMHVVSAFYDYDKFQMTDGPLMYNDDIIRSLLNLNHPVVAHVLEWLTAHKVKEGMFHIEVFWDGVNEPQIHDPNFRAHGGIAAETLERPLIGVNQLDLFVDTVAHPENPALFMDRVGKGYTLNAAGRIVNLNVHAAGDGRRAAPRERVLRIIRERAPTTFHEGYGFNYGDGEVAAKTVTMASAFGEVALYGPDENVVKHERDQVKAMENDGSLFE